MLGFLMRIPLKISICGFVAGFFDAFNNLLTHVLGSLAIFSSWCWQSEVPACMSHIAASASSAQVEHLLFGSILTTVLQLLAQHKMCIFSQLSQVLTSLTSCHITFTRSSISSLSTLSSLSLTSHRSSILAGSADGIGVAQIFLLIFCLSLVSLLAVCAFFLYRIFEVLRMRPDVTHNHYHYHNLNDNIKTNSKSIKTNADNFVDLLPSKLDHSSCFPLFDNLLRNNRNSNKSCSVDDFLTGSYPQELTVMMTTVENLTEQASEVVPVEVQPESPSATEKLSVAEHELREEAPTKAAIISLFLTLHNS